MSGVRLVAGGIVMGIIVPITLFELLHLTTAAQLLTLSASIFLAWGVTDLFSTVIEHPRLKDRSPGRAIREELEKSRDDI